MIFPVFERVLELVVRLRFFLTGLAFTLSVIALLLVGGKTLTQPSNQGATNRQLLMVVVGLVIVSGVFLLQQIIQQLARIN